MAGSHAVSRPPGGMGTARDAAARDLKFRALAGDLRRSILAGDWPPGSKLPTENGLAQETGLSLTTVRRAFDLLVRERLVVRRQGSGSFVASRAPGEPRSHRTVGVLVPDTQLYYPRVLQGVEEALSAAGAGLQLATYHYDTEEEARDLDFLLDSGVDGLLLVPTLLGIADPVARADQLMSLPIPAVLLERRLHTPAAADIPQAFHTQLADFAATVAGGRPRVSLEHSRHVVELVLAAYDSAAKGRPVPVGRATGAESAPANTSQSDFHMTAARTAEKERSTCRTQTADRGLPEISPDGEC